MWDNNCTCAAGAADRPLAGCLCKRLPASCSRLPTTVLPCSVTVVLLPLLSLPLPPPVMTSSVAFAGPLSVSNIACRNTASSAGVDAESKPARQGFPKITLVHLRQLNSAHCRPVKGHGTPLLQRSRIKCRASAVALTTDNRSGTHLT
jgi:hypothetical protein